MADTVRIEAEDIIRRSFTREDGVPFASGGAYAHIEGGGKGRGAVAFTGETGTYEVRVVYHDTAGGAGFRLKIGDERSTVRMNEGDAAGPPTANTERTAVVFDEISIEAGQTINLLAKAGRLDSAAIDYIEFVRTDEPPAEDPPADDPPADDPPPEDPPAESPPSESPLYDGFGAFEAEVIALTNAFRADNGRAPLETSLKLSEAAELHSIDMAENNFFSHTGSDGSNAGQRMERADYDVSAWGENIAAGYNTPEDVVDGWINSPGHRANMLSGNFSHIGIGYIFEPGGGTYGEYWTMALANGDSDFG